MSPIYIPPSNFYVYPYISYTKKDPDFILQQSEAVEVIEFPIVSFLNLPDQPEIMTLDSAGGHEVPVINFNGYIIWGATAMILSEFSQLLKKCNFAVPCLIERWRRKTFSPMHSVHLIF